MTTNQPTTTTKRPKRAPRPRAAYFYGARTDAQCIGETWLEPEEITYPSGSITRRARALCEDGALRVVMCGIPDTYFSIPARARIRGKYIRGYITSDESGFLFRSCGWYDRTGTYHEPATIAQPTNLEPATTTTTETSPV